MSGVRWDVSGQIGELRGSSSGLQGAAKAYIAATEIRGLWVTQNSTLQLQKQIHQQLKQYSSSRQTAVFRIRIALVAIFVYTSQYIAAFVLASVVCSLSSWLDVVCGSHHFWIAA